MHRSHATTQVYGLGNSHWSDRHLIARYCAGKPLAFTWVCNPRATIITSDRTGVVGCGGNLSVDRKSTPTIDPNPSLPTKVPNRISLSTRRPGRAIRPSFNGSRIQTNSRSRCLDFQNDFFKDTSEQVSNEPNSLHSTRHTSYVRNMTDVRG